MSGGGGGGIVSQVAAMGAAEKGPSQASIQYAPPPQGSRYQASYQPLQARQPTQQFQIPSLEQMGQFQQSNGLAGLQDVFAQMMSGNMGMRQPMQRGLVNPNYRSEALNYRPNLSNIPSKLNQVAPSVVLQERLAAEEAARVQAEQDAYNAANPQSSYDYGGG